MCRGRPTVFLRNYYRKDFTLKLPSVKNKDKANRFFSRVVLLACSTHLWMSTRPKGNCLSHTMRSSGSEDYQEWNDQRYPVGERDGNKTAENKLKAWEDLSSLDTAGFDFFEQGLYTCPQDPGSTDQPGRHLQENWVVRAGGWLAALTESILYLGKKRRQVVCLIGWLSNKSGEGT